MVALAAPLVLEETAKIASPDPTFAWPVSVAIDGDWIIATGSKPIELAGYPDGGTEYGAWLYRRQSDGSWQLVRRLMQAVGPEDIYGPQVIADAQGGVAAIVTMTAGTFVFERSGETWSPAQHTIDANGFSVSVDTGTILVTIGYCSWETNAYRKAADGVWRLVRHTDADSDVTIDCENEYDFDTADLSGSSAIVLSVGDVGQSVRIFEGAFGSTPTVTRLVGPSGQPTGQPIAIDQPSALARVADADNTLYAYVRDVGGWRIAGPVRRAEELTAAGYGVQMRAGLAVQGVPNDSARGRNAGAVAVFQRNADGTLRHVAKLVASDGKQDQFFGSGSQVSGRRIVARNVLNRTAYVFELPTSLTQPATVQDDFEDGNFSTWSTLAGSTFSVATAAGSKVLRQTSLAGDAAAFLNGTDWQNQSIEAEITPTAYASGAGSRWFGLVTRFTPGNYYYVTVRSSNEVQIRKMTNGAIAVLASATLPITLNESYRVRLESIGTRIRAFVDDRLIVEATDTTHRHGQAGLFMYKTAADYDNVVVSANPRTVLATYTFNDGPDPDSVTNWELLGDWTFTREANGNGVYAQSSLAGDARAIGGIDTDDQVIRARIKRTATAGTSSWFGLAARYRDAGNYYYVTLRNTNVVSLRKLVNGAIVELDSAPLTLTSNTWYDVRLAAIGNQLRVYVNDQLLLEAVDATHGSGRYGPVVYKSSALYDNISAVQP